MPMNEQQASERGVLLDCTHTVLWSGINIHSSLPLGRPGHRNMMEVLSVCGINGFCKKNAMQNAAEVTTLQEPWKTWEVRTVCTASPRLEMLP